MGALLSLPLMALPSMGTVRHASPPPRRRHVADIYLLASYFRWKLLRCSYLRCSMQCLREMREQVRALPSVSAVVAVLIDT
jgi:hypothetical protein